MNRVFRYLRDQLDISLSEAKGAFFIILFTLIILGSVFIYSNYSGEKESELSITMYSEAQLPDIKKSYNNKKYTFSKNTSNAKISLHVFNPNTASEEELMTLGFPKYLSKTINNYRQKGGKFKFKEDLLKIYGMKPELYTSLVAYISLPSKQENNGSDYGEYKANQSNFTKEPAKIVYAKKSISSFNINLADTTQLIQIKGIGRVFAMRIIKYRDLLGGFYSIDQVKETYGIEPEIIEELKKYCTIKQDFNKIKINQVAQIRHPYLKYNQAKAVIAFRNQHGAFKSINDLSKIKIIDESTIIKIEPYLDFIE